jgi:hypothetical protein
MNNDIFLDKLTEKLCDKIVNNESHFNKIFSKLYENISPYLNDMVARKVAEKFDPDDFKETIHNEIVDKIVDSIDTDEIKDSVLENINGEIDTNDIEERAIEQAIDNLSIDEEEIQEKVLNDFKRQSNGSIKQKVSGDFFKHLMDNPEFTGQVIEYVSDKLIMHLLNGNNDIITNKVVSIDSSSVENINKALISGSNLEVGTSGLPVVDPEIVNRMVDLSSRGI